MMKTTRLYRQSTSIRVLSHLLLWVGIAIVAYTLWGATVAQAQVLASRSHSVTESQLPEIKFKENSIRYSGDTLYVSFDVEVLGPVVRTGEGLHLVPVYITETQAIHLPRVVINGEQRAKYNQREMTFMSHEEYQKYKPYRSIVLDSRNPYTSFTYSYVLPHVPEGDLRVDQILEDCCDFTLVASTEMMPIQPTPVADPCPEPEPCPDPEPCPEPEPQPIQREVGIGNVVFFRPQEEVVKKRSEKMTVRIQFVVDKHDINPNLANNAAELHKVDQLFRTLQGNRDRYKIEASTIRGYASPEAPFDYNLRLSQRRADSFRSYLMSRYGLYEVRAVGMGEDWDGLRRAVAQSRMPYRDRVLHIIDYVGIHNGRERELMKLAGGKPYRFMLDNLYPPLRRMEMEVAYEVDAIEAADRATVYGSRPQDLSEAELFELAMSRSKASETFGDEFILAAKYFPKSLEAKINASSIALMRGEPEVAWRYLEPIQNNPIAYNNIGIYYYLQHRDAEARLYLNRALRESTTSDIAERNLLLLNQEK